MLQERLADACVRACMTEAERTAKAQANAFDSAAAEAQCALNHAERVLQLQHAEAENAQAAARDLMAEIAEEGS